MTSGGPEDTRLDARQLAARLGVTTRHLARIHDLPRAHYLSGLRRWWLSEIIVWEAEHTTATPPASAHRGMANLRRGAARPGAPEAA